MAGSRVREEKEGEGVCSCLERAAGGSGGRWLLTTATAQNWNTRGKKQVNAGLMGISIGALKQPCKQWNAVRAVL
jgi:hypothetical protein